MLVATVAPMLRAIVPMKPRPTPGSASASATWTAKVTAALSLATIASFSSSYAAASPVSAPRTRRISIRISARGRPHGSLAWNSASSVFSRLADSSIRSCVSGTSPSSRSQPIRPAVNSVTSTSHCP